MAGSPALRLGGLDAWRAGLMIFGIFFHAIPAHAEGQLFGLVAYVSSHFRMGAFFAISGFLTGFLAAGHSRQGWLHNRIARLVPPLVTGLLITLPSMMLLHPAGGNRAVPIVIALFQWFHLWFLLALIGYVPLAGWLAFGSPGEWLRGELASIATAVGSMHAAVIFTVSLACFALFTVGGALIAWLPFADGTVLTYLPLALCYAPIYGISILFGRYPAVCHESLSESRSALFLIVVLVGLDLGSTLLPLSFAGTGMLIDMISRAVLPVPVALLILRSAIRPREVPAWVARVSEASLTIYLIHFPLVALFERLTDGQPVNPYLRYFIVIGAVLLLSMAFHEHMVRRSRVLRWLFNGHRIGSGAVRLEAAPASMPQ